MREGRSRDGARGGEPAPAAAGALVGARSMRADAAGGRSQKQGSGRVAGPSGRGALAGARSVRADAAGGPEPGQGRGRVAGASDSGCPVRRAQRARRCSRGAGAGTGQGQGRRPQRQRVPCSARALGAPMRPGAGGPAPETGQGQGRRPQRQRVPCSARALGAPMRPEPEPGQGQGRRPSGSGRPVRRAHCARRCGPGRSRDGTRPGSPAPAAAGALFGARTVRADAAGAGTGARPRRGTQRRRVPCSARAVSAPMRPGPDCRAACFARPPHAPPRPPTQDPDPARRTPPRAA